MEYLALGLPHWVVTCTMEPHAIITQNITYKLILFPIFEYETFQIS